MYISKSAIKKLQIYLIILTIFIIMGWINGFFGAYFQDKSWEYSTGSERFIEY